MSPECEGAYREGIDRLLKTNLPEMIEAWRPEMVAKSSLRVKGSTHGQSTL